MFCAFSSDGQWRSQEKYFTEAKLLLTQLIHKNFQVLVVQHLQVDSLIGWKKLFQSIFLHVISNASLCFNYYSTQKTDLLHLRYFAWSGHRWTAMHGGHLLLLISVM